MAKKHHCSLEQRSRVAKLELDVAFLLFEDCNTPVSLSCSLLLKYGEYKQLIEKRIDPVDYIDADRFAIDYQCVSLLSKTRSLDLAIDKKAESLGVYERSEKLCSETNERLLAYRDGLISPLDPQVAKVISYAQRWIQQLIPQLNPSSLRFIEDEMQFGPGATVGIKRIVTSGRKFDSPIIDCTPEVLGFGLFCLPQMWKERVTGFNPVTYSELEFVPKNSRVDRAIEIQPSLNIYIQKGIGSWLRRQLANFGLDLSDQTPNQSLAKDGSVTNHLVTADLSSASDTIAHQCVRLLFQHRPDVLTLLEWARVGRCRLKDGRVIELEKFSAMGNGYTFELETLIFLSLILATRQVLADFDPFRVYGDDIIVSCSAWPLLSRALNFLGFNVNERKTFGNTYFRESCGADFFKGINVRPIFFKQESKTDDDFIEICYIYGNQLLSGACRLRGDGTRDKRYFRSWLHVYLQVPKHLRFRVPIGYEANGFFGSFDESVPSLKRDQKRGWQGYFFKYFYRQPERTSRYAYGKLISSLKTGGSDFSYGEEELRGKKLPPTHKTGYSLEWTDFGPWH